MIHLVDFLLVVGLMAACLATGPAMLRGRLDLHPLEALAFSTAIGSGVIATSILVFGLAGLLSKPVLAVVVGAWLLVGARESRRIPGLCRRGLKSLAADIYPEGFVLLSIVGLFLVV